MAHRDWAKNVLTLGVNLLTQYYTGLLAKQGLSEGLRVPESALGCAELNFGGYPYLRRPASGHH
jgi:hypothetical protein